MATKVNPLDSRVSATTTNNLRLPDIELPHLGDYVRQHGFTQGMDEHHKETVKAINSWKRNLEREIAERLQPKAASTSSKP